MDTAVEQKKAQPKKDFRKLAAKQLGLVSRRQLLEECGFSPDRIWRACESGKFDKIHRGVYRVAGVPESWPQRVMGAVLRTSGIASHRTAAALWGFDGFVEGPIEVSADKQLRVAKPRFVVYPRPVPEALRTKREGIPVTTVPRTLVDLASDLPMDRWGRTVEDALRRGLTSLEALREFAGREDCQGHPGTEALRAWLADGETLKGPSATAFQRTVRDLLRQVGGFSEEVPILDADGTEVARVDFLLDGQPVIVEADGRKDHSGRDDWWHDLKRRNKVTALGYLVLHVTPRDVATEQGREAFLARLRQAVLMCGGVRSRTG